MSNTSLVMTVLGKDRPGLVETLSQTVADHGGNWIESRMAHLAGQFAGIVRVEVEAAGAGPLANALRALDQQGLEVIVHADDAGPGTSKDQTGRVTLALVGLDQPGIVRKITQVLAAHEVNVEDLTTECDTAPTTGQQLFRATAELQLPTADAGIQLRRELEKIASDLMVDITIE